MQQDSPFECRFNGLLPVPGRAREDCKPSSTRFPWWDVWIGWPARSIVTGPKLVFWYSNSALLSNEKFGNLRIGACIQGT
jgi:hypothetical protein